MMSAYIYSSVTIFFTHRLGLAYLLDDLRKVVSFHLALVSIPFEHITSVSSQNYVSFEWDNQHEWTSQSLKYDLIF